VRRIEAIVEGHGECFAVPILLRRLVDERCPGTFVRPDGPIRKKRQQLVKPGELERAVELAGRQTQPGDAILVLLDADEDCSAELGPALMARACKARSDRHVIVVLAKPEFEAWFAAGIVLALACRAPSFAKLVRDLDAFLRQESGTLPPTHEPTDEVG
jgi:hypothetical protein